MLTFYSKVVGTFYKIQFTQRNLVPLTSQQELAIVLEYKVVQFKYNLLVFDHQTLDSNSKTELTKSKQLECKVF